MKPKPLPALLAAAVAFSQPTFSQIHPSSESARQNAIDIFNALHSAMRQWGSSFHHNGMSIIPATIPRGTILYHGARSNNTPTAPEWLAFDREHAESFAHALPYNPLHPRPKPKPNTPLSLLQKPLFPSHSNPLEEEETNKTLRGYLHTFTTTRPLSLLYLDGSSAGNSPIGTLDTQDYLLRLLSPGDDCAAPILDRLRAQDLCDVVTPWGYDGLIRMEIGFEVIHCRDFAPAGGLRRGVVDMVVARWAKRLGYMAADGIEEGRFVEEVFAVTDSYVDYVAEPGDVTVGGVGGRDEEARRRCEREYLMPVEWRRWSFTEEDDMIYVAISRVMERICEVIFDVRDRLEEAGSGLRFKIATGGDVVFPERQTEETISLGRNAVKELTEDLRWSTWKRCRGCAVDEICFIAMWPYGRTQDHYAPGCRKQELFGTIEFWKDNYWRLQDIFD
ncbi:hypothetical protein QBC34DRAFT_493943 [Podospora aff. communis PSN243]|uniref:Uncharacterized protein n=1 Tax=Podospora aff. communis PSN243 TaxID=3040156 RepID=A0AAV9GPZ0_9PEZI|nr:hypothetical protein QBC34DRAFT_493943 [Podospora aff. communis PSN243]